MQSAIDTEYNSDTVGALLGRIVQDVNLRHAPRTEETPSTKVITFSSFYPQTIERATVSYYTGQGIDPYVVISTMLRSIADDHAANTFVVPIPVRSRDSEIMLEGSHDHWVGLLLKRKAVGGFDVTYVNPMGFGISPQLRVIVEGILGVMTIRQLFDRNIGRCLQIVQEADDQGPIITGSNSGNSGAFLVDTIGRLLREEKIKTFNVLQAQQSQQYGAACRSKQLAVLGGSLIEELPPPPVILTDDREFLEEMGVPFEASSAAPLAALSMVPPPLPSSQMARASAAAAVPKKRKVKHPKTEAQDSAIEATSEVALGYPETHYRRAEQLMEQGRYQEAFDECRAIQQPAEHHGSERECNAWLRNGTHRGELYSLMASIREHEDIDKFYDEAFDSDLFYLQEILQDGRNQAAVDFKRWLSKDTNYIDTMYRIGSLVTERMKALDQARLMIWEEPSPYLISRHVATDFLKEIFEPTDERYKRQSDKWLSNPNNREQVRHLCEDFPVGEKADAKAKKAYVRILQKLDQYEAQLVGTAAPSASLVPPPEPEGLDLPGSQRGPRPKRARPAPQQEGEKASRQGEERLGSVRHSESKKDDDKDNSFDPDMGKLFSGR